MKLYRVSITRLKDSVLTMLNIFFKRKVKQVKEKIFLTISQTIRKLPCLIHEFGKYWMSFL